MVSWPRFYGSVLCLLLCFFETGKICGDFAEKQQRGKVTKLGIFLADSQRLQRDAVIAANAFIQSCNQKEISSLLPLKEHSCTIKYFLKRNFNRKELHPLNRFYPFILK